VKVTLAAVGRLRVRVFGPAWDLYADRLPHYCGFNCVEVKEATERSAAESRIFESRGLLDATRAAGFRVALDARGEPVDSVALARRLERALQQGPDHWAFCIGGSHGHDDALLAASQWRWSLGPLTLPHELARVVVAEQLYRAFSIVRGEPYHK
jgi:23S rRNA (pseudouridine1915-N3)-methyltransferase